MRSFSASAKDLTWKSHDQVSIAQCMTSRKRARKAFGPTAVRADKKATQIKTSAVEKALTEVRLRHAAIGRQRSIAQVKRGKK